MAESSNRERGLRDIIRETIAGHLRSGEFGQMLGKARASADAQTTADGIGIDRIRRGVATAELSASSDLAVTSTELEPLSSPLSLEIVLSGRPLRVTLTGVFAAGASADLALHLLVRRQDLGIIAYSNSTAVLSFHGERTITGLTPGRAVVEVHGIRQVANGTLYISGGFSAQLTAVEL